MEEITIEVKNLLYHICRRWRMFLVWMLLGALLADGVAVVKNIKSVNAAKAQLEGDVEEEEPEDLSELREVLTEKEAVEVEGASSSYIAYAKYCNAQVKYYNESILMQLDANQVPLMTLQYYVDNHYTAEYPVVQSTDNVLDIANALGSAAANEEVCEKINQALSWDKETIYIKELISYTCENNTLTLQIAAPQLSDCEKMGEIIKAQLISATADLQAVYGEFELKLAEEECLLASSADIQTLQLTQLSSMYSSKNDFRTSVSGFTDDQKAYYNALIGNAFLTDEDLQESNKTTTETVWNAADEEEVAEGELPSVQYLHKKYMILGILAGAFLYACWLLVCYIFQGVLRSYKDMQEGFELSVMGVLRENEKRRNPIDRLIDAIFCEKRPGFTMEEQLHMVAAAIRVAAGKAGMQRLYISISASHEPTQQLQKTLVDYLRKDGVDVQSGAFIAYDPEALETMAGCDGVVLMETIGCSLYDDILKEKQLCEGSHVPVLGTVVVDNR